MIPHGFLAIRASTLFHRFNDDLGRLGGIQFAVFMLDPTVVDHHQDDGEQAQAQKTQLQFVHDQPTVVSRICSASSISTSTIRDTPNSCIVTPTNWLPISIAILL